MAKVFKSKGAVVERQRRAGKSVATFDRPDLAKSGLGDIDPLEYETPVARAGRIYQEAFATGHEAGMEAGLARSNELAGDACKAIESAGEALRKAHAASLDSLEPQVVELAKTVAARILRREARTDAELVRNTVRAALENLAERRHATVRLNPGDLQVLAERGISIEEAFQSFERVEITADDSVPHGGCTIETKTVDVDARLDTQLMRIFEALEE